MKLHTRTAIIHANRAFTLTELLVVVAMMALLAGLGVAAFKGGSASDGSRGASYAAATLFDAARNEAIMRRTWTAVVFETMTNASNPENFLRRMTVAYYTNNDNGAAWNNAANWIHSGRWIKLPASAYFDTTTGRSVASTTNFPVSTTVFGKGVSGGSYWAYLYLPNGQILTSTASSTPLKAIFSPGSILNGSFQERPDKKSLYGIVINKLGHTQQFADLQSLTNCINP